MPRLIIVTIDENSPPDFAAMAGYFAGVVQAPMTAFVIILEMTGNHDNVIALMLASMLGYGTARMV